MKKASTRILALLLLAVLLLAAAASCAGRASGPEDNTSAPTETQAPAVDLSKDREGNAITLPAKIEKVIVIGPSNTEVLVALGGGDKIIGVDQWSTNVDGLKSDITVFDSIMDADGEKVIDLQPDVIFVTGMTKAGGAEPFKVVEDAGICVIIIPSSVSIDAIKNDIKYIAAVMGTQSKGDQIIKNFDEELDALKKIGDTIIDKKTVHFECSASPYIYGPGNQTFMHEMIELIGAKNVWGNQNNGWYFIADEAILDADPDVILTSTNYIDDPVGEIKARPGWDVITAVKDDAVYFIDTDASNRPNHNVVKALKEMAKAIYPDKY